MTHIKLIPFPPGMNVEAPPPVPSAAGFAPWCVINPAAIPQTRFAYGDTYAAGYLTVTLAAPKVGKSLLGIAEAVDAASGRGFLTGKPADPMAVLYFNAEDDQDVLNARVVAATMAHGVKQSEIAGRLLAVSGVPEDRQLVLISGNNATINEPAFAFLADLFRRERIKLAIFDPLQDLSQSPETNDAFRALGARVRRLAANTGVALGLVHHTRKPSAGVQPTMDDGRGGSALRGVARFNRLLVPMTDGEGAKAGVDDFRHYFRIAETESNLAPPSSTRNNWFEKTSIAIGNGAFYPAVKRWSWPEAFAGVTINDASRVRAAIAARSADGRPPRENAQAKDWAGYVVAEVLGLDPAKKADKARIGSMLQGWIASGVLAKQNLPVGPNRKSVPCLVAGPNNPVEVAE
ncbi:MAG: AAA family ATPase [Paracoccaceae bacterium]|nr:MAG: AAA family ATPase [Paracoccaceae bacterium]